MSGHGMLALHTTVHTADWHVPSVSPVELLSVQGVPSVLGFWKGMFMLHSPVSQSFVLAGVFVGSVISTGSPASHMSVWQLPTVWAELGAGPSGSCVFVQSLSDPQMWVVHGF